MTPANLNHVTCGEGGGGPILIRWTQGRSLSTPTGEITASPRDRSPITPSVRGTGHCWVNGPGRVLLSSLKGQLADSRALPEPGRPESLTIKAAVRRL